MDIVEQAKAIMNEKPLKKTARRFKWRVQELWDWIKDNKEEIAFVAPFIAAGVTLTTRVVRGIKRGNEVKKLSDLKNLKVYDPSARMYVTLKRPLRQSDWAKINEKRSKGQRMGEILEEMKLIK